MLPFEYIAFGAVMYILSVLTGTMSITSKTETKTTRVGFLVVSLGFALYATGLFMMEAPIRSFSGFVIGSGIITCGIGYRERIPKWVHIIMGLVVYGVMIVRFMI